MRHLVNFGLLFAFLALATTGILAFVRPFSLTTTQVHIAAGLGCIVLVLLHLTVRTKYFKSQLAGRNRTAMSKPTLLATAAVVGALLLLAGLALPPVSWLVDLSYETRQRKQIVRTSSLTGFTEPAPHRKLIARKTNEPTHHGLSLNISFPKDLAVMPAVAVWAETTAGTLIETLYLEQSMAYSDKPVWHGMKTQRNHILPLWRHRYTMVSGIDPEGDVDGMTGATESHQFALDPYLAPGEGQKFIVCVEVNAPADPNEKWPDKKLGQPSLLYTAYVKVDDEKNYYILELTGHGGGAESSGNTQYDIEGFTTAKDLVDLLLVKLEDQR